MGADADKLAALTPSLPISAGQVVFRSRREISISAGSNRIWTQAITPIFPMFIICPLMLVRLASAHWCASSFGFIFPMNVTELVIYDIVWEAFFGNASLMNLTALCRTDGCRQSLCPRCSSAVRCADERTLGSRCNCTFKLMFKSKLKFWQVKPAGFHVLL